MSEHIARQLWLGEPEEGKAGLTVAFASADHKRVDQHFGSCASLLIYRVAPDRAELLQVTEFNVEQGHNQGKLDSRVAVIAGAPVAPVDVSTDLLWERVAQLRGVEH